MVHLFSHHAFVALLWVFLVLQVVFVPSSSFGTANPPRWGTGVIPPNGSLYMSLAEKGISSPAIHTIVSLLSPRVDMRRIRPGTAFRFSYDQDRRLEEFLIELDGTAICRIGSDGRGWYTVSKRPWKRRLEPAMISGEILSTLEDAMKGAGEAEELGCVLREILARHIESCPEIQKGDRFRLIVDKGYAEDTLLRYGEIQAFEIRRGSNIVRAFRYEGDYYDENGNSLGQQFLRVPLDYHYVSSEFMRMRKHPILGGVRPHHGMDFAAPFGTPVWAVADGEVVSCEWRGGYGFTVVLRHRHGYETLYAHLQRYGHRIREGERVEKKQIIGYIGATGLSTGAHLHYSLTRNGKDCNPLLERFPRERITGADHRKAFLEKKRMMLALLGEESTPNPH